MHLGALLPCDLHTAVATPGDYRQLQRCARRPGDFVDRAVAHTEILRCTREHSTNAVSEFGMPEQVDGLASDGDHRCIGDHRIRVGGHRRRPTASAVGGSGDVRPGLRLAATEERREHHALCRGDAGRLERAAFDLPTLGRDALARREGPSAVRGDHEDAVAEFAFDLA